MNVHEAGFRVGLHQGPWPPAKDEMRIFMFGGSTLFGYGVRDEETISSQLQQFLAGSTDTKVSVYNFGQGILLFHTGEDLLRAVAPGRPRP